MLKKIVLDVETQKEFAEVGGRGKNHLLKVSVCGIYNYATDKYTVYEEGEMSKLSPILQTADLIIGFNIKDFDFEVIQPYLNFNVAEVPYCDLLQEVEKSLGHRINLNSIAQATLGVGKSGSGKEAILYYKNKRMDLLKKYNLDDVKITKQIYDYALKNHKVLYKDFFKTKEISVKIAEPQPRTGVFHQTALF
jgi:DEAD/DEAH box helicase domain-containing protein